MKKILLSGFEPFGGDKINSSLEVVKVLKNRTLNGGEIHIVQTPVVLQKSIDTVISAIKEIKPDVVVSIGEASGRCDITPERVAINMDDFRIKDNGGNQIIDTPVVKNAPDAYFSTLPIKAMVKAMQNGGFPSSVSNSAGTFVCNHLFYGVQHFIKSNSLPIRYGFVHIPLLLEQNVNDTKPSMSLESMVLALLVMLKAILDHEKDLQEIGGTIC